MGDDKPFQCNAPGCGMRFINEDHLTFHCKKHKMSIPLNEESSNVKSNEAIMFVDQTPTPTRFIRNCEEVGLFQDLNPFEEQFRKHYEATKLGTMLVTEISHGTSDNDILNTPSILPDDLQADTCDVLQSCLTRERQHQRSVVADEVIIYEDENDDEDNADNRREHIVTINLETPEKDDNRSRMSDKRGEDETEEEMDIVSRSASESSVAFSVSSIANKNQKSISQRPTVVHSLLTSNCNSSEATIGSPNNADSITITSTSASNPGVLSLPTIHPTPVITQSTMNEVSSADGSNGMVQLILKLPDGRTVPLHIPASMPASGTTLESSINSQLQPQSYVATQVMNSANSNSTSYAKMKLREALTQGTLGGGGGGGRINYAFKLIDEQQVSAYQEMLNLDSTSNDSDFNEKSNAPKRRRSEEDPEEKRKRFLERNRAAATRCRQKRKTWIRSLENKADELAGMNEHLQNEVAMLRNEVAQLKSMLLAHKDCPVTQQQQKHMGNLGGLPPGSTIIVSTCSNGTIQMSADEAIASSALTNLSRVPCETVEKASPTSSANAPQPVVLRAIMTHEQALGLLSRSTQSSIVKTPGSNPGN